MLVRQHPSEEIVDDSEPERAEIRRQQRTSNSLSTKHKQQDRKLMGTSLAQMASHSVPIDSVIEISDSDSDPHEIQRVSDKNYTFSPISVASGTQISNISNIEISSQTSEGARRLSVPPVSVVLETENSMAGMANIQLKDFAYTSTATNKKSNARRDASTPSIPTTSNGVITRPPTGKTLDLSKSDLGKVSRCICCDIAWTTRKTAIQKMSHIQSCAKKHAFDEETIRILIQKEIANHIPRAREHAKTKQMKPPSEEGTSKKNTLLEDVLVDAAPRKKVNRKQAETMLANISLTRDGILARAQAILSTPAHDVFDPVVQDTHVAGYLDNMDVDMPPSTHPFARSSLAQLQGTTSRTLFSSMTASPQQADMMCASPSDHEDIQTDLIQCEFQKPPLVKTGASVTSSTNDITFGPKKSIIPELIAAVPAGSSLPHVSAAKGKKFQKPKLSPTSTSLENEFANLKVTPAATRSRATTKTRTPNKTSSKKAHDFDEQWENHMKKCILQNVDLHCRVLRYEPVHFSVFMELAELYAPPGSKLKSHLRSFLDNQAIHFYEGLTWKR